MCGDEPCDIRRARTQYDAPESLQQTHDLESRVSRALTLEWRRRGLTWHYCCTETRSREQFPLALAT